MFFSGSEAMEAALKLARQFHLERKDTKRVNIIARTPSYMVTLLGHLLQVATPAGSSFQPMLMQVHHIDATYRYRMKLETRGRRVCASYGQQLEIKFVIWALKQ